MKNKVLAAAIFSALFLLTGPSSWAAEYQHHLKIKDMDFSWNLKESTMDIMISAKTTGWVGIGFNPEKAMLGANIILGYVKKGKVKIEDHFGHQKRAHQSDKKQGGKDHIANPEGSEENGVTTLSFTIPLDSGDQFDPPINSDGKNILIFAYGGKRDSLKSRHGFRTTWEVNLKTGEGKKLR